MAFSTAQDLQSFLKTNTGLRAVFVESWEGAVQPPYIVVGEMETDTVAADNTVYAKEKRYFIDLFTKKTDNETSAIVEEALADNDIFFANETYWLEDLRLVCHEYEI
jgi:hypothetical protein